MLAARLARLIRWCARWAAGALLCANAVSQPPPLAAQVAVQLPGAVTDLTAVAASDTALVLQWTEVRSGTGSPAKYLLRYGPFESFTWTSAVDVTFGGCGAPVYGSTAAGGRIRACVLGGLSRERMYQVQLVAYTGVLNSATNPAVFGPLSNIAEARTARRIGVMVIQQPPMLLEPLAGVRTIGIDRWGAFAFGLDQIIYTGHYTVFFTDSLGATVALGDLLVTRP